MLIRKTVIAAKIESTYGVDAGPTAVANAMRCRNLKITPLKVDKEKREFYQAYLGNTQDIPVMEEVQIDFEVEIAGAGTGGLAAAYGPLLRATGHSETLLAADVTGTAQAGSTTTITLAAGASAVDGFYNGMVLDATGGTGSGQSSIIIDYNGTTKVATLALAAPVAYSVTTTYAIRANAMYRPVSSAFEAVSMYHWRDQVLYKALGVRGTVDVVFVAKKIPVYKFTFMALYGPVTDQAAPTNAVLAAFQAPRGTIPLWVPAVCVHGYAAKMQQFTLDQANDVQHMLWMNSESIEIVDRLPAGKMTVEAVTVATMDYFTKLRNVTLGNFAVRQGTALGNSVVVTAPQLQIDEIGETEVNKVVGFDLNTVLNPLRGNDEYTICVM
jgi:hypothetical protein